MSVSPVERTPRPSSLADVLDVVLDKGIVLDAYARVSLIGVELLTVDARVVIASVDTYLRFAEAVNRLDLQPRGQKTVPGLMLEATETAAKLVTKRKLRRPVERVQGVIESITGRSPETEDR